MHPWPAPVRQAPGSDDCALAAAAFVCRLFGRDVSIEDVRRARGSWAPEVFPKRVVGIAGATIGEHHDERAWWLGSSTRPWVEGWLAGGHVGLAIVDVGHPSMDHAVVALEASLDGVLVMDPARGLTTMSWPAFLGPGPGPNRRTHRIEAWYGPR